MRKTVYFVVFALVACFVAVGCGGDKNDKGNVIMLVGDEMLPAGEHRKFWEQTTDSGDPVPPGTYGVWFTSEYFDSTAVFQIVADDPVRSDVDTRGSRLYRGYEVWTGSGAYVVGETVDVHVYLPEDGRVLLRIVEL